MGKVFESVTSIIKEQNMCGGGGVKEVVCCSDCAGIRHKLSENPYTYDILIFDALDRQSLKAAECLRERNLVASLIFLAVDAKKIPNIFRYRSSALVVTLDDDRQLREALIWACREQLRAHPYLTIRNKSTVMRVNYADIIWFESRQRIVILHGSTREISFYAKLSEVYELLPKEMFLRCHQSYIVNVDMIDHIDKVRRRIHLITDETIEISKSYYHDIAAWGDKILS